MKDIELMFALKKVDIDDLLEELGAIPGAEFSMSTDLDHRIKRLVVHAPDDADEKEIERIARRIVRDHVRRERKTLAEMFAEATTPEARNALIQEAVLRNFGNQRMRSNG